MLKKIVKLDGVKSEIKRTNKEASEAKKLLETLEKGKEYMFGAGKHAAIVRVTDNGPEYLEMQSHYSECNGWQSFNKYGSNIKTLRERFGCTVRSKCSHSLFYADVDSFKNCYDLQELLGYLDTQTDKQKRRMGT